MQAGAVVELVLVDQPQVVWAVAALVLLVQVAQQQTVLRTQAVEVVELKIPLLMELIERAMVDLGS